MKIKLLWCLLVLIGAQMVANFARHGRDFEVLWRTGKFLLQGLPVYSVSRDGPWVFKYPPWITPLFIPFAIFPLNTAKMLWGLFQLSLWTYVLRWTWIASQRSLAVIVVALAFWGLWQVNAMDGQVSLVMLSAFLWTSGEDALSTFNFRSATLLSISGMKVFTAFPLFALKKSSRTARTLLVTTTLILIPLSLPALWVSESHSIKNLVKSWIAAMASGSTLLEEAGTRGKYNQGLVGLVMRLASVPASETRADIICSLALMAMLGTIWSRVSRRLPFHLRWVGWIGLTPVIHPLPFWYSFVLTYPLAALALSEALKSRIRSRTLLAIIGCVCIAIITGKTLGHLGAMLELISIKSWGALACCASLTIHRETGVAE